MKSITEFKCDILKPVQIIHYDGSLFTGDEGGRFYVHFYRGGSECQIWQEKGDAFAKRADGETIKLLFGSAGNVCFAELSESCCEVTGQLSIHIRVDGMTALVIKTTVYPAKSARIIDTTTKEG